MSDFCDCSDNINGHMTYTAIPPKCGNCGAYIRRGRPSESQSQYDEFHPVEPQRFTLVTPKRNSPARQRQPAATQTPRQATAKTTTMSSRAAYDALTPEIRAIISYENWSKWSAKK